MATKHRPWPLAAGIATIATGVMLILLAAFGVGVIPPALSAAAIVLAALVELTMGALLTRNNGPGMAHIFTGVLALSLAMFLAVTGLIDRDAIGAAPIALAIGLFCLLNAVFRAIDVFVDRPQGALAESIDYAFSFVIGVVLLAHWREATPSFIAVAAGLELVSGGIALFGSVRAHDKHPGEPAYDGRADRLARMKTR